MTPGWCQGAPWGKAPGGSWGSRVKRPRLVPLAWVRLRGSGRPETSFDRRRDWRPSLGRWEADLGLHTRSEAERGQAGGGPRGGTCTSRPLGGAWAGGRPTRGGTCAARPAEARLAAAAAGVGFLPGPGPLRRRPGLDPDGGRGFRTSWKRCLRLLGWHLQVTPGTRELLLSPLAGVASDRATCSRPSSSPRDRSVRGGGG